MLKFKTVGLITKNRGKLLSARHVFDKYGIKVKQIKKFYPEIQADSSVEIAKHTALEAIKDYKFPIIREDHSVFFRALSGFPGPYGNYYERTIPPEAIVRIMRDEKDRSCYFELGAAIAFPNGKVKTFSYKVESEISPTLHGSRDNWDKFFKLRGSDKTFGELDEDELTPVWAKNFEKIAKYLIKKK